MMMLTAAITIRYSAAVSYTHLDVYKRQAKIAFGKMPKAAKGKEAKTIKTYI